MKAILCTKYGPPDVLQLVEVEKPAPREDEVLLKVCAASANPLDLQIRGGMARIWGGFSRPKDPRLGRDVAGRVEAVGSAVTRFKPGDEVFGVCNGAYAEYACARQNGLALKPANHSFEEAATLPVAGITALQGLRDKGQVRPGQKVLIYGASGGVGTFAVQIAKSLGAEVTAVCSPQNLDTARSIGADHVIDYTREDFTKSGVQYDLVLAINGYHFILDYRRALTPRGVCVMVGASSAHMFQALPEALLLGPLVSKQAGQKLGFMGIAKVTPEELNNMKELLEAGTVVPVIDRSYPLSQTAHALTYLAEGHARGKVVVTVE